MKSTNIIIQDIRQRASGLNKHIVLPEGEDPRVITAAEFLIQEQICEVTVLDKEGKSSDMLDFIKYLDGTEQIEVFAESLWQKRKHKLSNRDEAKKLIEIPLYFGASMVDSGLADGCVAGSVATTGDVIRAAIHVLGLKPKTSVVSSTFLMAMPDENVFTYADCGVVPYPDENQLADIAVDSARTHKLLTGEEPKVALLSFSTKGSAPHQRSQLVKDALEIAKKKNPELLIDGELQFDAAFIPNIAKRKAPGSPLQGKANVFIFPNLDAGNIAYKITERLGSATATGPILQGLAKPMMDLSRGCSWEDIVNTACVSLLMGD